MIRLLLGVVLALLLVSCGTERYPLAIRHGKTYLVTRDRTGQEVWLAIDTGSNSSFLLKDWVVRAGGEPVPGPPVVWGGVNLYDEGSQRATGIPPLPGMPSFLNGVGLVAGGGSSPLMEPVPVVGLLGTDLLWDWTIDFRGDEPQLVRGSVEVPRSDDRIAYDLEIGGGHYTLPMTWTLDPADYTSASIPQIMERVVVDTGSFTPLSWFHAQPADGMPSVANPRSQVSANGVDTKFHLAKGFRVGTFLLPPLVVLGGQISSGSLVLLGTPALRAAQAVVDLKGLRLSFSRTPGPLPITRDSPEAWAWKATVVPGQGIRVDVVLPGSTLDRRGFKVGDIVPWIGTERADQPRSALEWKRAWEEFATESPCLRPAASLD